MRALALEYHDVFLGEDPDASGFPGAGPASYKLPLADFVSHLAAISKRRVSACRVADWVRAGGSTTPLFITFDDGGLGALWAADALETHGWRGHFFITAGRLGTPGFLSGQQLVDLCLRGHVIGTHSMSHPKMMGLLSRDAILSEWRQSKAVLESALGSAVLTGSVPGGFYRPPVGEAAAAAGLEVLFTSTPTAKVHQVGECTVLGRYTIRHGTKARTAAGIAAGAMAPRAAQALLYGSLTMVRSIAGNQYTRLRDAFWSRRRH